MNSSKRIWILEDDGGCNFVYKEILDFRYKITFFTEINSLMEALNHPDQEGAPDLLIADLRLGDGLFTNVLSNSQLKERLTSIKLLVVSSNDDIDTVRFCYDNGASDFLTKPFSKNEIIVKLERLLRNPSSVPLDGFQLKNELVIEQFIDSNNFDVYDLTSKERKIISLLIQNNNIIKKNDLIHRMWPATKVQPKTLDVHLSNLRKKLIPYGLKIYSNTLGELVLTNKMQG